jgi:cell wall assembly regulator SMI1
VQGQTIAVRTACGITAAEADEWSTVVLRKRLLEVLPTLATVPSRADVPKPPVPPLVIPPEASGVLRAWLRLERFMDEHFTELSTFLGKPADAAKVAELELPADLAQSFLRHDGEGEVPYLLDRFELIPLDEAAHLAHQADVRDAFPLGKDNDGNYLCVQCTESEVRLPGWIFVSAFDDGPETVLAESWTEYFERHVERFFRGELWFYGADGVQERSREPQRER